VRRLADRLEEAALVAVFAVMTAVAFVNVITRYVVRYSLAFTEEVVVSLFVWLTLLGTAIAFRQGGHLAFTWVIERCPRGVQRAAAWLATGLGVVLFAVLAYYGVRQIENERMLGTTSEALAIPQWWYTAGIPVFGVLVIVRIIQAAWQASHTSPAAAPPGGAPPGAPGSEA
jgi:TRAP-type C4-dicarboxylate transport system permease small subunit